MKTENIKSVYVRTLEGREVPSKSDITKGITSKDLKEKERSLNYLIINIINDCYYEQNIMLIITHILPYQSKSTMIKKLLLVYWEIIQKRKHNGVVLDEFLLVCNNLRNELNHSNEFVVGATLKLIGRIAIHEIIDSLLQPVYENGLKHIEPFVRRNAVECLFELYVRFGEEVLHGLDDRMREILAKESDTNTKRNAVMLLFKVNPKAAVEYVSQALHVDGIESFSDIIQLVIVKNLFELCRQDSTQKGRCLLLAFEFLRSPFNSVLFEIGNSIAEFSGNAHIVGSAVTQLVRIMQDIPDVSIKLVILQKLFFFKSLSAKYLENAVPECLKLLETENTEVRIKIIKLVTSYLNQANIDEFMLKLKMLFQTTTDPSVNELLNDKLKKHLLKTLMRVLRLKTSGRLDFKEPCFRDIFTFLVEHDHKNNSNTSILKAFLELLFSSKGDFKLDVVKISINSLLSIQNSEVFSTLFTLIVQEIESESQSEELLELFFDLNVSLKELAQKLGGNKQENLPEVKKVQTVKTVIKEDGSYGSEIIEETTTTGQTNLENSKFKFLAIMLSSNSVFLVNFFRNISHLTPLLKQNSRNTQRLISSMCHSVFILYNLKQKEANKEEFVFTELNQLIKIIVGSKQPVYKIRKPKLSLVSVQSLENTPLEKSCTQFDQMLNFRILGLVNKQSDSSGL